jgi:ribulose 1,5-bisphosphate synthetase/thiazole synthase
MILYFVIIFNLIGRICSTCKGGHVVSEENKTITFDVIIVGAGISGLEVYRKLSA